MQSLPTFGNIKVPRIRKKIKESYLIICCQLQNRRYTMWVCSYPKSFLFPGIPMQQWRLCTNRRGMVAGLKEMVQTFGDAWWRKYIHRARVNNDIFIEPDQNQMHTWWNTVTYLEHQWLLDIKNSMWRIITKLNLLPAQLSYFYIQLIHSV